MSHLSSLPEELELPLFDATIAVGFPKGRGLRTTIDLGEAHETSRREDASLPLDRKCATSSPPEYRSRCLWAFKHPHPRNREWVERSFEYWAENGAFHMDVETITEIDSSSAHISGFRADAINVSENQAVLCILRWEPSVPPTPTPYIYVWLIISELLPG